jgi:hypothetical protein
MVKYARQNLPSVLASSVQSNAISTTQTTTLNQSTSSKRSSLPSQQKITKRIKLDTTSTSNSNVPMNGYTIVQNQVLFCLMSKTRCGDCGNCWNGTMNINKREGLFFSLLFQCSSCGNSVNIGK